MFRVKVLKISAGEPLAVLRAAALEDVAAVAIFEALEEAVLPLAADEAWLERPFHRSERRERVVGGRQLERRGDVVPGRDDVLRALEGAEGPQRRLVVEEGVLEGRVEDRRPVHETGGAARGERRGGAGRDARD